MVRTKVFSSAVVFFAGFIPVLAFASGPSISNVQVPAATIVGSGAQAAWNTDVPSDSWTLYDVTSRSSPSGYIYNSGSRCDAGGNVTSHCVNLTGLSAATLYYYRVASTDASGTNSYSSEYTFTSAISSSSTPAAPTSLGVSLSDSNTKVNLSWTDNSSNETRFEIYRQVSGGSWVYLTQVGPNVTTFSESPGAGTYNYQVAACNGTGGVGSGCSSGSNMVSVSVSGAVPSVSSLTALSSSAVPIGLSWTFVSGATSYTLSRRTPPSTGSWSPIFSGTTSTTFADSGVTVGTNYEYHINACNLSGCSADSNYVTVSVTGGAPDTIPPSTPTGLSGTAIYSSQVNLSWGASTDNVGVSGYKIYRNGTYVGSSTAISYADTGLSASTTYSYTVAAYDYTGNVSSQSSPVSVLTFPGGGGGGDTMPPSTPTGLVATPVSSYKINISWVASTDNYGVAGYKIYRNSSYIATVSSSSLWYSDAGLTALTSYIYAVSTFDAAGNESAKSSPVSVTTLSGGSASSSTTASIGTLAGSVQDSSGVPIASAGIHVYTADFSLNFGAMTSSSGAFSINLPAGDYLLEIYPPYGRYDLAKPDVLKVSLSGGETKNLTLKFAGTVKTITGQVLFSNGLPATDAQVGAFSNNTYQWTSTVTDSAGNYTLKVGSGKWQVGVKPTTSSRWSYSGSPLEVAFGNDAVLETKLINFLIPVVDVSLVLKTIDQSGNAVAGAGVVLDTVSASQPSAEARPSPQYAQADSTGTATFTLRAGTYFVRAFLPPDQGFSNPDEVRIDASSGDKKQITLIFRKRDAASTVPVNGITKLSDGTPIDAFVWAWSEQGGFLQTRSASDGSFVFQVPKNTKWHVGADKELNGSPYKTSDVIVVVTDTGTSVELILAKLTGVFLAPNVNVTQSATQQVVAQAEDGAKMTLPPSAAGSSGNVNVSIDPTVEAPSQAGARTIGTVYDIKANDQSGNQIKSLQSEAEIVLPYSKDELKRQGVAEDNIIPSYFDDSTGAWRPCESYTIDKDKSVAVCRVKHLTRFAIVAAADVVPPDPPANVRSAKNGLGEVVVSWVNPAKDFSHVRIYRSSVKGILGQIILDNITVSQSKDKSAAPGVNYYYTVRAVDPAGNESTNIDQVMASGSKAKAIVKFSRNLKLGMRGDDVTALQEILINERVYPEAAVTGYFGPKTKIAVIKFQEKYKADILVPAGLDKGNGFIGAGSRAKLDAIYKALLDSGAINQ